MLQYLQGCTVLELNLNVGYDGSRIDGGITRHMSLKILIGILR